MITSQKFAVSGMFFCGAGLAILLLGDDPPSRSTILWMGAALAVGWVSIFFAWKTS